MRADAEALARFDANALADAFQASDRNPLAGLDGMLILNTGAKLSDKPASMVREDALPYVGKSPGDERRPAH